MVCADSQTAIAFGPVPSRRLGQSLGINHIPPKSCTYDCAYCQVGRTPETSTERRDFYPVEQILAEVSERVSALRRRGERIDYLSFVPDGEPTLDLNLGAEIEALRPLGLPIAVISNGSLLWDPAVRATVKRADLVSVKVDTVNEKTWQRLNRPDDGLRLDVVLEGMRTFAAEFEGRLISETMLLDGINDSEAELEATARFVAELRPEASFILVPTRPPAETWARCPAESVLARAYDIFATHVARVEVLTGLEPEPFGTTGDAERDILATAAVHPLRDEVLRDLLSKSGASWDTVDDLVRRGLLTPVEYRGRTFYLRPVDRG